MIILAKGHLFKSSLTKQLSEAIRSRIVPLSDEKKRQVAAKLNTSEGAVEDTLETHSIPPEDQYIKLKS